MTEGLTKTDLVEMALRGEFADCPQRFTFNGTVVEIFDDGFSPGLLAVEIWNGERLGNECYVSSYSDEHRFVPAASNATNGIAIGAPCEFCGEPIDSLGECDECSNEVHERCLATDVERGALCPRCHEAVHDDMEHTSPA